MANSPSARKRARQAEKRRKHNASLGSKLRTVIKKVVYAIKAGDKASAQTAYAQAAPVIDGMVNKKIIHRNKAARHKSRLSSQIKALASK